MPFPDQILNIFSSPSRRSTTPQTPQVPKTPKSTRAAPSMSTQSIVAVIHTGPEAALNQSLLRQSNATSPSKSALAITIPTAIAPETPINTPSQQQAFSATLTTPRTGTKRKRVDSTASPGPEKKYARKFIFHKAKILELPEKDEFSDVEIKAMVEAIRHNEGIMKKWKEGMIKHIDTHERALAIQTRIAECMEKKNLAQEHYIKVELKSMKEAKVWMKEELASKKREIARKNRELDEAEERIQELEMRLELEKKKGREEDDDEVEEEAMYETETDNEGVNEDEGKKQQGDVAFHKESIPTEVNMKVNYGCGKF
ncbi:hypothetical protein BU16DRAFT_557470 [Lophium mytilinum]|uniref:Uncharacterized protein n=1 Tax=Lophium mytilinum TaxID=390894 RepID=A0A6A6R470_9PEZI|nr:hypothetical protein BU16DRAFT_557470 [Lophium mytilinum]